MMSLQVLSGDGLLAVRTVGKNTLLVVMCGVQPAVRSDRDAMRATARLPTHSDLSARIDLEAPVLIVVSEVYRAVLGNGGIGGQLIAFAHQLPIVCELLGAET